VLGLGAFAAGVLLANTNYRAQVQADIGKVCMDAATYLHHVIQSLVKVMLVFSHH
jgi:hypothetical protein